jgi:hypothetical protein
MQTTTSGYPLRLTGELSPRLSRWLWLVKWLLAIPHLSCSSFSGSRSPW